MNLCGPLCGNKSLHLCAYYLIYLCLYSVFIRLADFEVENFSSDVIAVEGDFNLRTAVRLDDVKKMMCISPKHLLPCLAMDMATD